MKTSSAKDKGRRLQKHVVQLIYKYFPSLAEGDVESRPMGSGGEDVMLSAKAREEFPLSVECKSMARVAVYKWYAQAQSNGGDREPVVIMKQNKHKPLALIDAEYLIKLMSKE